MVKTPEQIVALVREAGVSGAAGLGFPTYLKLQSSVNTVIINGSECEPLLHTDQFILSNQFEDVIEGLKMTLIAMKAKNGVIALNRKFKKLIDPIQKQIAPFPQIKIHLLEDYYPAGDEFLLVYDVTKIVIPENAKPIDIGVAVFNVATAMQIYQAVNGKPTTERTVTIAGEVKEPKVVTVPIGARYSDLISLAGGPTLKEYAVIDGGPMMGNFVEDLDEGISKSTRGVLLLPLDHFVVRMKSKTLEETIKTSKAASGQNSQTTEFCPRHLLGHQIEPHRTLIALDYQHSEPNSAITSAFLCSGCGLCELFSCDSTFVSPKKIYQEYQRLFQNAKIENPHRRAHFSVHSQYENRKVATPMLLKKLGLSHYPQKITFTGRQEMPLVKIPLQKRWGAPTEAMVQLGQQVRRGDIIAEPRSENLGSIDHASIHGTVSNITEHYIEITGVPA